MSDPTPPTEDEREKLARLLAEWHDQTEETWENHEDTAEAIMAAGFRDRSISDREVAAKALRDAAEDMVARRRRLFQDGKLASPISDETRWLNARAERIEKGN